MSPCGTTPPSRENLFDLDAEETSIPFAILENGGLKFSGAPSSVELLEVSGLGSPVNLKSIFTAESQRHSANWLVVYVRATTTAVLFPPRQVNAAGLGRSGLIACMEWLEDVGVTQIFAATPNGDEALSKSLQFLGFSRVPKEVLAMQLPYWGESYTLLVTDLTVM